MDRVFYLILIVCTVFYALVIGLMALFVIRYRSRPRAATAVTASHNTLLEITWTVIPLGIVAVIFWQGFQAYMDMRTAPAGCYEIRVTGQQWSWLFAYPNGHVDENLHVPVDEPVRLTMTSKDVIHSLWIPDFRVKMDLVPGRYTSTWFRAVRPGTYTLLCAEYCGDQHSDMLSSVVVHPTGEFEEWLKDAADYTKRLPPVEAGKLLYQRHGCAQCHSIDGTAGNGPTFKGIFGETHDLVGGGKVLVDENYIRESILEPQAQVRAGFQPIMSTYQGQLSDDDIAALIEFIKSLGRKPGQGQP
jgi:cytochrome c oxidase subunit 2